jgi:hypothetical protein
MFLQTVCTDRLSEFGAAEEGGAPRGEGGRWGIQAAAMMCENADYDPDQDHDQDYECLNFRLEISDFRSMQRGQGTGQQRFASGKSYAVTHA